MKKLGILALLALFVLPMAFATSALSNVNTAIFGLYCDLKSLLPVAVMLMIVLAGVIYAAGQMMGAETRARANVWATSCLTGALVGLLIATIAPAVLSVIAGGSPITC